MKSSVDWDEFPTFEIKEEYSSKAQFDPNIRVRPPTMPRHLLYNAMFGHELPTEP